MDQKTFFVIVTKQRCWRKQPRYQAKNGTKQFLKTYRDNKGLLDSWSWRSVRRLSVTSSSASSASTSTGTSSSSSSSGATLVKLLGSSRIRVSTDNRGAWVGWVPSVCSTSSGLGIVLWGWHVLGVGVVVVGIHLRGRHANNKGVRWRVVTTSSTLRSSSSSSTATVVSHRHGLLASLHLMLLRRLLLPSSASSRHLHRRRSGRLPRVASSTGVSRSHSYFPSSFPGLPVKG